MPRDSSSAVRGGVGAEQVMLFRAGAGLAGVGGEEPC